MAVSMFEDLERVKGSARIRPERLGTHVAAIELRPGHGICIANTGGRGHWSVWGRPNVLAGFVVSVVAVDE